MSTEKTLTNISYWLGTEVTVATAPVGTRIMVISAHPDDIESECAGTLALASDSHCEIRAVLVTSGGDTKREQEAIAAGARLGLTEIDFLRYPDGEVTNSAGLRRDLVASIRRWRPEVLFTYDPEFALPLYISHPDHRAVGRATIDAVHPLARHAGAFPDLEATGLGPHKVASLWLFASAFANTYVDITETVERKIAARLEHESQSQDREAIRANWERRAAETGARAGLAAAEAFTVITLQ